MSLEPDSVELYGQAAGFEIKRRNVLVEGTSDLELLRLASSLERSHSGINLLNEDIAILPAGEKNNGGVNGVLRELITFRGMARTCLLPNGRPKYRFIALFDNDRAGRMAISTLTNIDSSILEFRDVFRLWPIMSIPGNLDPITASKIFNKDNAPYKGLDWELEDLLSEEFLMSFLEEQMRAVLATNQSNGKTHREWSRDGKANLHRFTKRYAIREDVYGAIHLLKALRYYLLIDSLSVACNPL